MSFETGGPSFGLQDLKIATWNATNDYSTEVDVMSARTLSTTLEVVSAKLEGDDKVTATATRIIGAEVQMEWGGVSIAALEVMIGNQATSSIASPNNVKVFRVNGGEAMPNFGVTGRAIGAENPDEDSLVFMPKCTIMSNFNLVQLQYGQIAIPNVTVYATADGSYGIFNLIQRESGSTTVEVPPANIPVNA